MSTRGEEGDVQRYAALLGRREHYRVVSLRTPFHRFTDAWNGSQRWRRWNGYLVAERYTDSELEHAALRNACTVADISPMTKYDVSGPEALAFLERLLTGRIATLEAGQARYVLMCDGDGLLLDDGLLFHLQAGSYRLCCRHPHLDWLMLNAAPFDIVLRDVSHDVAALSLQGPTSGALLRRLSLPDVQHLAPNALARLTPGGVEAIVSRTGFSGDLGYELWMDWDGAAACWEALFRQADDVGLLPAGEAALDLARLEAGYVLAGREYLPANRVVDTAAARTPLELGLERYVDFERHGFNGRAALAAQRAAGPRRRLLPVLVEGSVPATDAIVYNYRRRRVGVITSAAWSPAAKQNIAFALLDAPWGRPTDALWADIHYAGELDRHRRRVRIRPHVVPFYDPVRRRVTPAGWH
jgi:aminomethyltransferase